MNAAIYFWKRKALIANKKLIGSQTNIHIMPQNRSIDIDTKDDFEYVEYLLKKMEKIDFKNKKIFVIGGYGLIGNAVANLLNYNGAKVFILDQNKLIKNNFIFCKFKVTNQLSSIENNLEKIFNIHGVPHGVINCSYPTNKFWKKVHSKKLNIITLMKILIYILNLTLGLQKFLPKR